MLIRKNLKSSLSPSIRSISTSSTAFKSKNLNRNMAGRPEFSSPSFTYTQPPKSDFKPGTSELSSSNSSTDAPFKVGATEFKKIDPNSIEPGVNYKLLINGIIPRPIAFVSSQDQQGVRNLAPFSYFGIVGHNPPLISISVNASGDKKKDTAANILATKRFCVSIISTPFVSSANFTAIDAPHDVSEWYLSGLTPVPNETWGGDEHGPPRVGESAYSLECELYRDVEITNDAGDKTGTLILGRVKNYLIRSDILRSDNTIDPGLLLPISRGGGITYFTTKEGFEIPRPKWEEEKNKEEIKKALG